MRVSIRSQKVLYVLVVMTCVSGAVVVVAWGIQPVDDSGASESKTTQYITSINSQTAGAEKPEPRREDFAKVWDRPLRRVLYDPPPPAPVVKQVPPLRVEVLGTIIEPANSMAMIRSEQGSVEYKRVGDALGPPDSPASLVEIGADTIVLDRAGERITLGVQNPSRR